VNAQIYTIYEDEDLVALNKPAGVIFDWAVEHRPELLPVHRLDKDTSGIILFAKNARSQEYLKQQFQKHEIKKTYLALVGGKVKFKEGTIDLPMGRSKKAPLKRVSVGARRGKLRAAVTRYEILKRFEGLTLVEAYPETGRTHQIRSHFAAIGHPVVCDKLYAGKKLICPGGLSRQFLHAAALELTLPSGGRLRLEADLPADLAAALKAAAR
jgi:RluA family pseudouridine synthase